MKVSQIFITGYYGFGNLGDETVLAAMLVALSKRIPLPSFTVTSGNVDRTRHEHGVRSVAWQDIPATAQAVKGSDLVIIGGGGLFQDYWGVDPAAVLTRRHHGVSWCASTALLAELHAKPLMVYGAGVGPLESPEGRELTREVFQRAWRATVRDRESRDLLISLGVPGDRVAATADPAFATRTPTARERGEIDELLGVVVGKPVVGVCPRNWNRRVSQSDWLAALAAGIGRFAAAHDATVVIVPFSDADDELGDDVAISHALEHSLTAFGGFRITHVPASGTSARALLGRCDLVVGMRLHSVILSAVEGTPVLAVAYDPKVSNVMAALSAERWCVDLPTLDADMLLEALEALYKERESVATRLADRSEALALRACESADLAAELMRAPAPRPTDVSVEIPEFVRDSLLRVLDRAEQTSTVAAELVEQRDGLDANRRALADRVRELESGVEARNREIDTQQATIDALEDRLSRIAATKMFRAISLVWQVRDSFAAAVRTAYTTLIPDTLRRGLTTRRQAGGLLPARSWYAYAFDRLKRSRAVAADSSIDGIASPGTAGLVSVVLPVFNGADWLRESLDSLLEQTYPDFEVIAINDGSTDTTAEILEDYAARDERVRVIHQDNRKLPRTLSRGFRYARGEYLTWTSADNRCKPEFLEKMVACLERHPHWDMIFANVDIIGDDGLPLRGSHWFAGYQHPPGSEHVHLPTDPSELNTWPNNYVCAAFMYRSRVAWLLGDYSPHRFTTEDYDYWMRVNEMLTLRHVDFDEPLYEYRFHGASLTARDEELGITRGRERLMVFDDFRRDALLSPVLWSIKIGSSTVADHAEKLRQRIRRARHREFDPATEEVTAWPELFVTSIMVNFATPDDTVSPPPSRLPRGCLRVLAVVVGETRDGHEPKAGDDWDLCVLVGGTDSGHDRHPYHRWLTVKDVDALFQAAEIRAHSEQFAAAEAAAEGARTPPSRAASLVICTHQVIAPFRQSVLSAVRQEADPSTYEVLVVNNRPGDENLEAEIRAVQKAADAERPGLLRIVHCPLPGLSHARNSAVSAASGEIVIFLDDDAVAQPSLVPEAVRLFAEQPQVGVIGGHIRLVPPDPKPMVLHPGWERYWSHLMTDATECRDVEHWWQFPWGACWGARRDVLLAIGGFRCRYGRVGNDYSGGEEVIAATLGRRLGFGVAVAPELEVEHHVERSRYTWRHVRRTIIAGTLVNYQAQRDLYLPMWEGIGSTVRKLLSPSIDRTVGANSAAARARHWLYRKEAWLLLLRVQVGDRWRRLKKPRHEIGSKH